jgi:endonuclease/exonuclease/phosphatase (EEP) superfamily protein YafD
VRATLLFFFHIALIGLGFISFVPLLWHVDPRFVALVPAAPQFAAAGAILAVAYLLVKAGKPAVLAGVIVTWNLVQFWPALGFTAGGSQAEAGTAPVLKVVALNLWYRNVDPKETLAYLAHSDADVIGLVEATPRLKDALLPLKILYPYSIDCVARDPSCEIMLLSKHPLENAYAGPIDGRYPYIAEAALNLGGRRITVVMTHLSWPFLLPEKPALSATELTPALPEFPDIPRLTQSVQAANLARHVNNLPGDLVLMGDFNSASWSAMQQAFRAETGLENHGYLLPSWPTWAWPILRLPIDHVFVRGQPRVTKINLGPNVGSDHLPVEAEIAIGQ